jgi:hypothetical protein
MPCLGKTWVSILPTQASHLSSGDAESEAGTVALSLSGLDLGAKPGSGGGCTRQLALRPGSQQAGLHRQHPIPPGLTLKATQPSYHLQEVLWKPKEYKNYQHWEGDRADLQPNSLSGAHFKILAPQASRTSGSSPWKGHGRTSASAVYILLRFLSFVGV